MERLPEGNDEQLPRAFDVLRADEHSDEELDAQPFGVICLDGEGKILRYNLAEARMARFDRAQVFGRNFFRDVAPCTQRPAFEGRFRSFVAPGNTAPTDRFPFLFDFKFGAQEVEVELVRAPAGQRFYLCINRRRFLAPRGAEAFRPAPMQDELAPGELHEGVVRDGNQRRHVQVSPLFFEALRQTWDRVAPQGWPVFCAEWGLKWGRLAIVDLETEAIEETGRSLRELPMRQVVGAMAYWLKRQGWGQLTADFTPAAQGAFVLTLSRGALGEAAGASEVTRCQLFSGLFRAFFGHLASKLLSVREVCCAAQGHGRCEFVVVSLARREALDKAIELSGGEVDSVLKLLAEAPRARP